ncbi:MAG: hypothetical protein ACK55O_03065 [Phycisphaerales bacterium]
MEKTMGPDQTNPTPLTHEPGGEPSPRFGRDVATLIDGAGRRPSARLDARIDVIARTNFGERGGIIGRIGGGPRSRRNFATAGAAMAASLVLGVALWTLWPARTPTSPIAGTLATTESLTAGTTADAAGAASADPATVQTTAASTPMLARARTAPSPTIADAVRLSAALQAGTRTFDAAGLDPSLDSDADGVITSADVDALARRAVSLSNFTLALQQPEAPSLPHLMILAQTGAPR